MTKSEEDIVEFFQDFIKKMLALGYAHWYIGKQVAILIWALDTLKKRD